MSERFHIKDMTISFEYRNIGRVMQCICQIVLEGHDTPYYLNDDNHEIRTMCRYINQVFPPNLIYNFIIERLELKPLNTGHKSMALYEEYFGSDGWTDQADTNLKPIPSHVTEKQNNDRNSKTKLGITFWGALIVEDILDDDCTNIKLTLPLTHDITW